MTRPFPFALNIGTDICHISRIQSLLRQADGRFAQRFVHKILNDRERKAYQSKLMVLRPGETLQPFRGSGIEPHNGTKDADQEISALAIFLSGRWAAKEATIKAHRTRRLTMHDITILSGQISKGMSTAPIATVRMQNGVVDEEQVVKISISHDGEYATATCLAAEDVQGDIEEGEIGLRAHKKEDVIAGLIEGHGGIAEGKGW